AGDSPADGTTFQFWIQGGQLPGSLRSHIPSGTSGITEEDLRYLAGKDSATDMIKGVATVLVDRGIKIEKGLSYADRVLGSAFFIDPKGILVTNYHVIASEVDPEYNGVSRLYIRMGDASSPRIPAKVLGWDPVMDLAVIKAEVIPEYVFSVIGAGTPKIGDKIYAIGSPAGLEKTVTSGIVSALNRRLLPLGDVIQIDAAVNHGNSGGPVVDEQGRLVGVVFAGAPQYQGLNFAVPAQRLLKVLPALLSGGGNSWPWLGLVLGDSRDAVEVLYSFPKSPAFELNIPLGTRIQKLNDHSIDAPLGQRITQLQDFLANQKPGELVRLETDTGSYILAAAHRPEMPLKEALKLDTKERLTAPLFGMILTPAGGTALQPRYMVHKVVRGSIADESGLSEQDPLQINGFAVDEKQGIVALDISVKKRKMGYLEMMMRLYGFLNITDIL
ncbi:MAG: trypsin-like peptidase domain-containing protein, partial [Termitinemataceae bacterium]